MPRGVPASGKRQPRAVPADQAPAETPVAAGAMDWEARDETPADVETYPEIISVELVADEVAEPDLTPEQQEIQFLKEQIAQLTGVQDVLPEVDELSNPGDENNIIIHFLEDGFSALGRVFYRGDELEFEVGSRAYQDTFDKRGKSWLQLRTDEFAQVDRWGKIMFRNGPWPGKTYRDGTFEALRLEKGEGTVTPPSKAEIDAAERARKRRAAPRLPAVV